MKITIIALAIAICLRLAFEAATGQTFVNAPIVQYFHSRIGGDWLIVRRHNEPDSPSEWDPSMTNITCSYQPIVHKLSDGRYEIEFTSEIAKDLP